MKEDSFKLPEILSYYNKSDYSTQQKARFIYYLCIAAIVGMVFLILSSIYVQLNSIEYNGIYLPVFFSEIAILSFFGICIFILIKGKYSIATHLFMIFAMACVWYIMWVHGGNVITRLDTVVLIIALLNLTPLFITEYKIAIPFYIIINVIILIVFVFFIKDLINLSNASVVDYIIDTSVAMIFTGVVGYNIFKINKQSLEKVESDNLKRINAENALKQSELIRRRVFESSNTPIIVMDSTSFKYIDINAAAVKIYGFPSREASLGKTPIDVSAPIQYDGMPSSQKAVSYIEQALEEGSATFEWLHQRPNGELWDAEVYLLSFQSDGQTLLQFSIIDITEQKKAEKALKESQQLFRALTQVSPVGIFRTKANGYTTYVNPKWMELSGLSFEDAMGDGWLKAVHPEDKEEIQKSWELHSGKKEKSTAEYRFIKPDGSIVWVLGNAEPEIVDNKIIGYIGTITDITEKKIIEKELEKHRDHLEILVKERTEELATSNEELTSTNEELHNQREELEVVLINLQNTQKQLVQSEKMASLGVLASGVAHEINNPLNFIKGGIFGLEQYFDENLKDHKEEVSPLIEGINVGIERAANIVTSLNHYSRRNDSKLIECDIHAIIDNCLAILHNQTSNRIEIEKNYTTKLHLLNCNEGKLHQTILNILSNAVQAIYDKGIINIKTSIYKQKIIIQISDTGCGISDENMSKIFDPFFTTKEAGEGTGLGLSISQNILEEHNGTIEFKSSLGHGTTVKITLPLKNEK